MVTKADLKLHDKSFVRPQGGTSEGVAGYVDRTLHELMCLVTQTQGAVFLTNAVSLRVVRNFSQK